MDVYSLAGNKPSINVSVKNENTTESLQEWGSCRGGFQMQEVPHASPIPTHLSSTLISCHVHH